MVRATAYLRTLRTSGAPRESASQKSRSSGGLRPSLALDAAAAPPRRWLRPAAGYELVDPRAPGRLHASRAGHSRAARGVAIADGLATAQTRPGRPGGRCAWGSLRLATRLVVADEALRPAASLPKSRCAPHRESPRRAARPDGSSTGRQLRTRPKSSDAHGQPHGQPWPTIG